MPGIASAEVSIACTRRAGVNYQMLAIEPPLPPHQASPQMTLRPQTHAAVQRQAHRYPTFQHRFTENPDDSRRAIVKFFRVSGIGIKRHGIPAAAAASKTIAPGLA